MKLLTAFIEASGFDVEEVQVLGEKWEHIDPPKNPNFKFVNNDDVIGHYIMDIDYKVTKRKPIKQLDVPLCKKPTDKTQDMVTMCEILIKHNMTCFDFVMEVGGKFR